MYRELHAMINCDGYIWQNTWKRWTGELSGDEALRLEGEVQAHSHHRNARSVNLQPRKIRLDQPVALFWCYQCCSKQKRKCEYSFNGLLCKIVFIENAIHFRTPMNSSSRLRRRRKLTPFVFRRSTRATFSPLCWSFTRSLQSVPGMHCDSTLASTIGRVSSFQSHLKSLHVPWINSIPQQIRSSPATTTKTLTGS